MPKPNAFKDFLSCPCRNSTSIIFCYAFFFCLGIKTVYNLFSSPNYPVVITSDVALYSELYRTTISFLQTLHFGLYYDCF